MFKRTLFISLLLLFCTFSFAQKPEIYNKITELADQNYPYYLSLYRHLHQFPELSFQEKETSKRIAEELKKIGYEVTENFGGYGIVGILQNGEGPVILVRADMDALPIEEKTGLPYASKVKATGRDGNEVSVMHACGHDIHMTVFIGTARTLFSLNKYWKGTIVLIGQPAEERGGGAKEIIDEGLYTKFPVPDYCLALHVTPELETGQVGFCPGPALASVDAVDIIVYGEGGHGALPQTTIDPVVLSARLIMALQTIVSRENSPLNPAVVTVGAINGGSQHNIIPDQVNLKLTLRSYKDEVRRNTIESIRQISRGIAISAGLPEDKYPDVIVGQEYTPSLINDIELTDMVKDIFITSLGENNVLRVDPLMVGEDFSQYGRTEHNIPIFLFWLGTTDAQRKKEYKEQGKSIPPLHSPFFAPDPEYSIKTGIRAMTSAVIGLMNGEKKQ